MIPNDKHWKGVRPVRFAEEIFDVLIYVANNHNASVDGIRNILKISREKREEIRLRAIRSHISWNMLIGRKRKEFLTKAEQFVRVLRRIGMVTTKNNFVSPTKSANRIIELYKNNEQLLAKTEFLKIILNSKFESYKLFLYRILEKPIKIPKEQSARNSELRKFLFSERCYLDIWSFYILRDFFYSFGLVNYVVTNDYEEIFPTCTNYNGKVQTQKIDIDNKTIYYWSKTNTKTFVSNLSKIYLELTGGMWDRMVDLIQLRDAFSMRFGISDNQFNHLLMESLNNRLPVKIIPNSGVLLRENRKGYLTKVINLPINKNGLPYTLLRMSTR